MLHVLLCWSDRSSIPSILNGWDAGNFPLCLQFFTLLCILGCADHSSASSTTLFVGQLVPRRTGSTSRGGKSPVPGTLSPVRNRGATPQRVTISDPVTGEGDRMNSAVDVYHQHHPANTIVFDVLLEKDLVIVTTIIDVLPSGSADALAASLLRLFEVQGQCEQLLKAVIAHEVDMTIEENRLFRGNTVATNIMTAYCRMTGTSFLKSVLAPFVEEIWKQAQVMCTEGSGSSIIVDIVTRMSKPP